MPSDEEKARRKSLLRDLKQTEKEVFLAGLPMTLQHFLSLFDYVDDQLEENGCDDSLQFSEEYLGSKNIEKEKVTEWLNEHGAFCDCEVIANVEEQFEGL